MVLVSPAGSVARVGVPKFGRKPLQVTVKGDAVYDGEDDKYVYFLANPGRHEFIGE
jgi:hypothetical protein